MPQALQQIRFPQIWVIAAKEMLFHEPAPGDNPAIRQHFFDAPIFVGHKVIKLSFLRRLHLMHVRAW